MVTTLGEVIQEEVGRISINWAFVSKKEIEDGGDCDAILRTLIERGIPSLQQGGNYSVVTPTGIVNPCLPPQTLFFTREQDAEAYKETNYKNARYPVYISKGVC